MATTNNFSSGEAASSAGGLQQDADQQIITVQLAGELYGIDISHIHTVITPQTITSVPRAPAAVKGVINLRGRVVPAIDLRKRFGMPPLDPERTRDSRIVIVEASDQKTGLIVDAVLEVLSLPASAIDPPSQMVVSPEMGECILGIGRLPIGRRTGESKSQGDQGGMSHGNERIVILLDVIKTLNLGAQDGAAFTARLAA